MNPSLTRMLIALEAQQVLVGVDEYSADHEPAVAALPRVGGLFNPSLEAVVALEPDLVVVVPSVQQRDFRSRLRELGVEVIELTASPWIRSWSRCKHSEIGSVVPKRRASASRRFAVPGSTSRGRPRTNLGAQPC